jgi:transcriptional/translational regulatory protein YebC/TACO1
MWHFISCQERNSGINAKVVCSGTAVRILALAFQTAVRSSLEELKYEVLSCGIFYVPNHYCSLDNEKEATAAEALIKALENCAGVTAVHHNLA